MTKASALQGEFPLMVPVAYAREGGLGGQNPPIEDFKRNENLSFGNNRVFSYRDSRNCSYVFCALQLAYKILKNFHCDAIIGLPVVKLFWCAAFDVDTCRKSETFSF